MNDFINTLTGIDKVLYRTSYEFELKYSPNATPESAHQAGLEKLKNTREMMAQFEGELQRNRRDGRSEILGRHRSSQRQQVQRHCEDPICFS